MSGSGREFLGKLRPIVQRSRIKICAVRPDKRVYLWIESHLGEHLFVT
jgi:hypothetical protein